VGGNTGNPSVTPRA